jgi:hypothetical protein
MPPEDKSPLNPESVLAAAFADHDFIGPIGRQAVHIKTSDVVLDGAGRAYIVVDATTDPQEYAATYRYRVTFDRVETAQPSV